jgi:hypothetical protein
LNQFLLIAFSLSIHGGNPAVENRDCLFVDTIGRQPWREVSTEMNSSAVRSAAFA